jgi:hypothetical protein
MTRPRRIVAALCGGLAAGAGAATIVATPASASGGCSGSLITINSNPGAEPPSRARGHAHATGNHYIKLTYPVGDRRIVVWWADNNGGRDGDTTDTYYTSTTC